MQKPENNNLGNPMENWLNQVLQQLRWQRAHEPVAQELKQHMADVLENCLEEGATPEEAREQVVKEMGDPVEVGTLLDRTHRPKPCVSLFLITGGLILLGALLCLRFPSVFYYGGWGNVVEGTKAVMRALICIIVLIGVYLLDYTWFGKAAIGACTVVQLYMFSIFAFPEEDIYYGLWVPYEAFIRDDAKAVFVIKIEACMLVYMLLYAALIFQLRNSKANKNGLLTQWAKLALLVAFSPLLLVLLHPFLLDSIIVCFVVLFCMGIMVISALTKVVELPKAGAVMLGLAGAFATVYAAKLNAVEEMYRVKDLFTREDWFSADWMWVPRGKYESEGILYFLTGNTEYYYPKVPFTYNNENLLLLDVYRFAGPMVAVLVSIVLIGFGGWCFYRAVKLRSILGRLMGTAAATVLLVQIILHLLNCFLLFGSLHAPLPFLSENIYLVLVNTFVVGILLSAIRMDSVVRDKGLCPEKKRNGLGTV